MPDYLTYGNLIDECERIIKHYKSSQQPMVKAIINMTYREMLNVDEMHPLHWLVKPIDDLDAKSASSLSAASAATPCAITTSADHGLITGDVVSVYSVAGMTELNNRIFHFTKTASDTGTLQDLDGVDINSSSYTAYTGGGSLVHRGKTLSDTIRNVISFGFWDHDPMIPISFMDAEKDITNWSDSESRPLKFTHYKRMLSDGKELDRIIWYPGCDDDYDCRLWEEIKPSPLSDTADIPQILAQFHHGIIAGVAARLAENKVQVENQVVWPGIYTFHLNDLKAYNRRWWKNYENIHEKPFML